MRKIILSLLLSSLFIGCGPADQFVSRTYENNAEFRDLVVDFVRHVAESDVYETEINTPIGLDKSSTWDITIAAYIDGEMRGEGDAEGAHLASTLETATHELVTTAELNTNVLPSTRFLITFNDHDYAFIEYDGTGLEVQEDLVMLYELNRNMLLENIELGKEYLLRTIDPELGGVHKYYYALTDDWEDRLHTIYTSSTIFTLLMLYDYYGDEALWEQALDSAEFVLFMQNQDEESRAYGGFHYSYYTDTEEKEEKYVVGTTSKTIFSLLMLYERTENERYLDAAKRGADWLLTMQNTDGTMDSYIKHDDDTWMRSTGKSFLYNGQVLSALSRMYIVTQDRNYYDAATKIATYINHEIADQGCYLGDDYREPNPISSSWAVLSLYDYYKATQDSYYKDLVYTCSDDLVSRQITDETDIMRHGRWTRGYSSSGNGWLNEVLNDVYDECVTDGRECGHYKDALVNVIRWVLQSTYSEKNMYVVENPEMSLGGIFWNYDNKYVRTDSVCHGMNAYLDIVNELEDGVLVSLPEAELEWIFPEDTTDSPH